PSLGSRSTPRSVHFALLATRPQLLHSLFDHRLIPSLHRLVIPPILWQVRLVHPPAFVVVAVLILLTVPKVRRALVVRIAPLLWPLARSSLLPVLPGLADGARRRIRLGRRRDVKHCLRQRQLALRQPDDLRRLQRRRRDDQRLRVRVPHVLRRADDHPPRD